MHTLMTLLRILFFGRIGSTKLVLPKWQNIDILNRDNRVPRYYFKGLNEEGKKASGGPGSDLGNLTPRAFVIVYIWPHWHDNGGLWTC